jgi:transposase InsO family protein
LEKLRRRNPKLEADLTKTRLALDITGKAHTLLEELSESADNNEPALPGVGDRRGQVVENLERVVRAYNHDRPHSQLGYRTPRGCAAICPH